MKNRNQPRLRAVLIQVIAGLIIGTTVSLRPAYAQTAGPSWTYTGSLNTARFDHTATLLADGRVLITGGAMVESVGPPVVYKTLATAEIYDPRTGTFTATGTMTTPRVVHTSTLLPDGKVLITGGVSNILGGDSLASAEIYDPATRTFAATGDMITARDTHTATLLNNGQVLIAGGFQRGAANGRYLASAELYDPSTGIFTATGDMIEASQGFGFHTATLLNNGQVLITKSVSEPSASHAELYDPSTGTFVRTGDTRCHVHHDIPTATLLKNGKVLVAGGDVGSAADDCNCVDLYDPATGTFAATGNMNTSWDARTATLLADGTVLIAGGRNPGSAEIYDPVTGTFSTTADMNTARDLHTATLLNSGKVLITGGEPTSIGADFSLASAELYDTGVVFSSNPIDDVQFFVRQQYLDFLNREPDSSGLAFWSNEIASCGMDQQCVETKRINVSAAFFLSIEFQQTGFLVYRMYKAAYVNLANAPVPIKFNELLPDAQQIGRGVVVGQTGWETLLENNKQAFSDEFVNRLRFTSTNPQSMTPAEFVDKLNMNAGNPLSQTERDHLVSDLTTAAKTRAQVLRAVAENQNLSDAEFNRAFVLMQYFGYLRRNPDDAPDSNFDGYNFWLNKLNSFNGNFVQAEMVKAFLSSTEYRQRFGQ